MMHMVATNLCVWMRTISKESIKEIALYRVDRGQGVSEDYMILRKFVHYYAIIIFHAMSKGHFVK